MIYRLSMDGALYSAPSSIPGLKAQIGYITGFPEGVTNQRILNDLINNGETMATYHGSITSLTLEQVR